MPSQTAPTALRGEPVMRRQSPAVGATSETGSSTTAACAFGALMVGAAAMRKRSRAAPVARRLTMQQIESITLDDIPEGWRGKISLGMARRDKVKQAIRSALDDMYFIMAFDKTGMATAEFEEARNMFPPGVMVRCLKNSLVRKAMEGTPWEEFGNAVQGSNAFVFVKNDTELKPTVEAYVKFAKKFNRDAKVTEMFKGIGKGKTFTSTMGGILRDEWNLITPDQIPKLKDFPTKTELIGQIAYAIKQVPQKIAVGTRQVPQKLAVGLDKIKEKMEEGNLGTVGDVKA